MPEQSSAKPSFGLENFTTLPQLLVNSVERYGEREALRQFDKETKSWHSLSYAQLMVRVMEWRRAYAAMNLERGTRIGILMPNSIDHACADQAALANGLVPVPLHAIDTPGASAFILSDSRAKVLVTNKLTRWKQIKAAGGDLQDLTAVIITENEVDDETGMVRGLSEWLAAGTHVVELPEGPKEDDLAGIVYTSGTTGRPKGVMITHRNIVSNVQQINKCYDFNEEDVFLSFLPFSHTFERTVAHYNSLANGGAMAFARNAAQIENDLREVRPTLMCSVPRIYEKIHQRLLHELAESSEEKRHQTAWALETGWRRFAEANHLPIELSPRAQLDETVWPQLDVEIASEVREIFGGRLRATFAGGASLNYAVARFFCALGINILQLYGLTETSPIVSFTRMKDNHPDCVGHPVPDCEVKLGANDELLVRGPQVMKGYWNRPLDTAAAFEDGWFRTGDQADLSDGGRVRIKGRIKEIIVTSTGEKIPPVDVEFAIQEDRLFEQVLVIGDNLPYVTCLVVVNPKLWPAFCADLDLDPEDPATLQSRDVQRQCLRRVRHACRAFPQYGVPRAVAITREPWTVDNGLLTPTMKLRRPQIMTAHAKLIERLYASR